MDQKFVLVILCGGCGSRLWPLSRQKLPKQFMPLVKGQTLFDKTVQRVSRIKGGLATLFVTTNDQKYLVKEALAALGHKGTILVEPEARNTAAALSSAALWVADNHPQALMLVVPSDQLIGDEANFCEVVARGADKAREGGWVLLGVEPENPSDQLGYIKPVTKKVGRGEAVGVAGFIEKPDRTKASQLLNNGWLWHAGISIVAAQTVMSQLSRVDQRITTGSKNALKNAVFNANFVELASTDYAQIPALQIDKCLLENCDNLFVIRLDGGWNDVGSFFEMQKLAQDFGDGNRIEGDVLLKGANQTYVHSPHRLTVAVGVDDLDIVDTKDALLVARKGANEQLKSAFETLSSMGRPETVNHNRVARPWGHYDVIADTPFYKVKCILIRPGCSISKQFHYHRAEHWVVVAGRATVTCDNSVFILDKNQSTFVPQGSIHRVENKSDEDLELVEVQTGSLLSEDDIVRLDDVYNRC